MMNPGAAETCTNLFVTPSYPPIEARGPERIARIQGGPRDLQKFCTPSHPTRLKQGDPKELHESRGAPETQKKFAFFVITLHPPIEARGPEGLRDAQKFNCYTFAPPPRLKQGTRNNCTNPGGPPRREKIVTFIKRTRKNPRGPRRQARFGIEGSPQKR